MKKLRELSIQHIRKQATKMLLKVQEKKEKYEKEQEEKLAKARKEDTIVLNVNGDSWKLETEMGVVMDGDKTEHLREAIPVIGSYCDIIGVRSFAGLTDRERFFREIC